MDEYEPIEKYGHVWAGKYQHVRYPLTLIYFDACGAYYVFNGEQLWTDWELLQYEGMHWSTLRHECLFRI
jgi:hypothetical protein